MGHQHVTDGNEKHTAIPPSIIFQVVNQVGVKEANVVGRTVQAGGVVDPMGEAELHFELQLVSQHHANGWEEQEKPPE